VSATAGELVATLPGLDPADRVTSPAGACAKSASSKYGPTRSAGSTRCARDGLVAIDEWIDRYRRYWADHLDALERHLERKHKESR
jgi:hypothetical protein